MSRRGLAGLGLVVAGGAGYYLYSAGGDPKAAEKKFEADVHKASAKVQGEAFTRSGEAESRLKEAEKRGEAVARQAGDKFDKAAYDAQKKLEETRREAGNYAHKASSEFNKSVDKFDATVEAKAAQAKSGISSWFGGK